MSRLPLLTPEHPEAEPAAAELLTKLRAGMSAQDDLPWRDINVYGALANHPTLLRGFIDLSRIAYSGNTLTPDERELAWLATSAGNNCHY